MNIGAQVEAMARVLDPEAWHQHMVDTYHGLRRRQHARHLARAALSSPVVGDLIAEALRTLAVDARQGDPVGNASYSAAQVGRWLEWRAAALSPTPADGTTSERSEA